MQKRNVLSSPRLLELKKHRRKNIRNKILISLLAIAVVFGLLAYLSRLNNLNIADIQVTGNKIVDTEVIKSSVRDVISGKYLWLFPKSNVLYYSKSAIKKNLESKLFRLNDISLSIASDRILHVSVTERQAIYTWCGATPEENKCYFMDKSGYVFDEAPYFSGEVYFKFYGLTDSGLSDPLGSYFSKPDFQQLNSFRDTLVGLGLKPVALYVRTDGDADIFLTGGKTPTSGPMIIFDTNDDFQTLAENLQAALNTEPLLTKFKTKYSSLQYIDLRFGNRVYDKFSS